MVAAPPEIRRKFASQCRTAFGTDNVCLRPDCKEKLRVDKNKSAPMYSAFAGDQLSWGHLKKGNLRTLRTPGAASAASPTLPLFRFPLLRL
jgi:hypothetical protein